MPKDSKGKCDAASHKLLKETTKSRVHELQGMVTNIQIARKEGRTADISIWEEQKHRMLGGWDAKLNDPSRHLLYGGSLGSLGTFSEELARLLKQHCDEKDDAQSPLKELPQPKLEAPQPNLQNLHLSNFLEFTEEPREDIIQGLDFDQCHTASSFQNTVVHSSDLATQINDNHFEFPNYLYEGLFISRNDIKQSEEDVVPNVLPDICPPESAFLGPKCALWDRSRPAQVSCQDYCSGCHALLARNEGFPGNTPILRPHFLSSRVKRLGSGSFLVSLEGPLRVETGLPEYSGRGWHRSRKQYEANKSDACALYKLELKFGTAKKSSKGSDLRKEDGKAHA
ncbi:hypothetical protein ACFX13_047806 [Malus domestica]